MAFNADVYKTEQLIGAFSSIQRPKTFLRDRYFSNVITFHTNDVLIDYKDGTKRLAPFVAPRKGGVTVLRDGYTTERFTPPYIAPRRVIDTDDIAFRAFGEQINSNATPESRAQELAIEDMADLNDMISRREEQMAASVMINGSCTVKEIADDASNAEEKEIRFYTEEQNPYVYTTSTKWNASGADIFGDLAAMVSTQMERGLAATDLICAADVVNAIINDEKIQKFLDIRNYHLGEITESLPGNGSAAVGTLIVNGVPLTIMTYQETYTADDGTTTPFIPAGTVILAAPNTGSRVYGAVTQVEEDSNFHTYEGDRIPKVLVSQEGDTETITLKSRPIIMPQAKGAFLSAKVL